MDRFRKMGNTDMRLSATLTTVLMLSAGAAFADTLTVVHQGGASGDAMQAAFIDPYASETGVAMTVDVFAQELARLRSQVETGNVVWDVVSVNPLNEAAGCEEGLLEQIDWSAMSNEADFEALGGFRDCGAPYLFSPGGLVYDGDEYVGDAAPQTWQDFWDTTKYPGKRGMLYQPDQTLELALMADGVEPGDVPAVLAGPGGVDRAFKKLEELKPHIVWWKTGDESMRLILSGEVEMVYAWQGRTNAANNANGRNLVIQWPAGFTSAVMYMGIMKGTPNKERAVEFVGYGLTPKAQAAFSEIMGSPPANAAAYDLISETAKQNMPSQHLDKLMLQAGDVYLNFWLDNGDEIRQRFATFAAQ